MYSVEVQKKVRQLAFAKSRRTGFAVDADELFSVAEYAIARHLGKYNPTLGVPFIVWATQRAHWAMQDELRRWDPLSRKDRNGTNQRRPIPVVRIPLESQTPEQMDRLTPRVPADRGEAQDLHGQLSAAIARLTERDRRMVQLYWFEDLTLTEIARREGVTEAAISLRFRQAIYPKLRRYFKQAA